MIAQTVSSNLPSRSATSLNFTNSTPGTSGANGTRYFSVAVTLSAPKVRPWKELVMARIRVLAVLCVEVAAQPGQLQCPVDSLGATVGKENAVEARPLNKFARQRPLKFVVK